MITTAEVIRALICPEDAFTCIAAIANTRCISIIQLNTHERFENTKALALTNNLKILRRRLDQVVRLVLCDAHRKENVVQEYIRRWNGDENVEDTEEESGSETSELNGSESDDSSSVGSPPATAGPSAPVRIKKRTASPNFQPELFHTPVNGNNIHTFENTTSPATANRLAQKTPGSTPKKEFQPVDATYDPRTAIRFGDNCGSKSKLLAPPYEHRKRTVSDPSSTTQQNVMSKRPKNLQNGGNSEPVLRVGRTVSLQQLGSPTPARSSVGLRRMPGYLSDDDDEEEAHAASGPSDAAVAPNTSTPRPVPMAGGRRITTTTTLPEPKTSRAIDDKLRKLIKTDLSSEDHEKGAVYIFRDRDPKRSNILKIGMTKQEMTDRRTAIQRECNIVLEYVYDTPRFAGYKRAEKLAQEELTYFNRLYKCSKPKCSRNHREWFEVSEDLAEKTVERWAGFMRQNPYDENGKIKDEWVAELDKMVHAGTNERMDDHRLRSERWKFVEQPSRLVHAFRVLRRWLTHPIWEFFLGFFWHLSCVAAWFVIFCTFTNPYTAFIFCSYLLTAVISMFLSLWKQRKGRS
ncbi:hypothetical protein AOQ84DRAFT_379523 [Glonium stellatum]|uniref:Bacteriophage T5 Orf172 DNA-binding domain-containing protein n=1 Tax=Glonium stellatum TaxID=574774 RepID=A0A8E2EV85_9PEZI|nr:hypothetical protein AOQ84DRAFT_379523 [Glonium stellatum]